jgi:thiol-disulfide isomerase/thioredoxin
MAHNFTRKSLVILIALGVLAAGLYWAFQPRTLISNNNFSDIPEGSAVGQRAPDFSGITVDGKTIHISDYQGDIVLVNLFASWCGPCLAETPYLVEAYKNNREDVMIVGLNLQESPEAVSAYQDDFNVDYPLVLDPEGHFVKRYHPLGLPTSWFIDPEGIVRYVHSGPMDTRLIQKILDDIRSGNQPDPFTTG